MATEKTRNGTIHEMLAMYENASTTDVIGDAYAALHRMGPLTTPDATIVRAVLCELLRRTETMRDN